MAVRKKETSRLIVYFLINFKKFRKSPWPSGVQIMHQNMAKLIGKLHRKFAIFCSVCFPVDGFNSVPSLHLMRWEQQLKKVNTIYFLKEENTLVVFGLFLGR